MRTNRYTLASDMTSAFPKKSSNSFLFIYLFALGLHIWVHNTIINPNTQKHTVKYLKHTILYNKIEDYIDV